MSGPKVVLWGLIFLGFCSLQDDLMSGLVDKGLLNGESDSASSLFGSALDDSSVGVWAKTSEGSRESVSDETGSLSKFVLRESMYETRECYFNLNSRISERELCIRNTEALHEELACEQDEDVVLPTGRRLLDAGGGAPGRWEQVGEMRCVAPEEESNVDLQMAVETEFAQLPIAPAPITIQPGEGWTFVNVPTIVYSSPDSQVLTTELLGTQVEIEVTPSSFSWDFDDDTASLETVDPGQPYPHHTVDHTYVRTGVSEISLTTTWTGQFRPNASGPWLPITGTATTTTTAPALEIREATARLVEDPLN